MKNLSNNELISFCSQLSLILHSGISASEGLSIMLEDTPQEEGRKILQTALTTLEETGCVHLALKEAGVFPSYLCSMTEIGEQTGRLDDVMADLSRHYQREEAISQNLKAAVTYPFAMILMMLAVVLVLIVKVLPIFNQVFIQLGTGLTGLSGALMRMGTALNRYAVLFIVLTAVAVFGFFYVFCSQKAKEALGRFSQKFFLTRNLSEKIACARFASGMSLSLSSGLDTDQSLEMAAHLTGHPGLQKKIAEAQTQIAQGESFSKALGDANIFSSLYTRMLTIGFKTGATDDVMRQIAEQYDNDVNERINGLVSKLEPTIVAILSVLVGMILLSVMLPLMGIMSNIG